MKYNKTVRRFSQEHHDNCTNCNRPFKIRDTTHLGYASHKKLVNVGDCCSSILKETIVRHDFQKRPYSVPDDNTILWRFMDFTKFVSLINSKKLYFNRADQFADPFEGAKGLLKNKKMWDAYYLEYFVQAHTSLSKEMGNKKTDKEIRAASRTLLKQSHEIGAVQLQETFINCWHENDHESEAMWKLYTSTLDQGIVIKTTYKRLYAALGRNPSIQIGRVNYIDFKKNFAGPHESFWFKRKSFEHEKEVRAIYVKYFSKVDVGQFMPVNLNTLIDKIYVSPTAQNWFKGLVGDVLKKYNLNKKIGDSAMRDKPFH